ncbi:uncharacterized protein TRAVEDRAFT_133491 [Trametes versicolor FP-101664 SS1]|uniref:uncharacterized protein n=1 Tax=Trametes versicolor (strain FP-101664) TaxID=717944 RepID=UPI000462325E|nr:uncharacterized protein TRAVEDRAFT_133491 [Trametes versicolor FP-101664 SS1]EIW53677.1 hypothetical protein TRAVEDRAFT_133491 [Trametes versicolor FP-101664 SS1]
MEEIRGVGRGSYIWGRSVHNIRIERLWVDVTAGFGNKWKELFRLLEALHGLDVDNDAHIWLLQHLFLVAINADASNWAATWNQHAVSRRGERHMSPMQMYIHGLAEHGQRGIFPEHLDTMPGSSPAVNYADYGIDWDALDRPVIRTHHDQHNPHDGTNPFLIDNPSGLSHVEVPDPRCPFSPEQVALLDTHLRHLPCFGRENMQACAELWVAALQIARNIV